MWKRLSLVVAMVLVLGMTAGCRFVAAPLEAAGGCPYSCHGTACDSKSKAILREWGRDARCVEQFVDEGFDMMVSLYSHFLIFANFFIFILNVNKYRTTSSVIILVWRLINKFQQELRTTNIKIVLQSQSQLLFGQPFLSILAVALAGW